jgi:hypothetical protein
MEFPQWNSILNLVPYLVVCIDVQQLPEDVFD